MMAVGSGRGTSGRGPLAGVSWLDWKLGARLLLKYPALTIIGGLSLAGAIAIGAVGIEVADELLYKRLPFDEGSRVVRLETYDTAASRVEPQAIAIRKTGLERYLLTRPGKAVWRRASMTTRPSSTLPTCGAARSVTRRTPARRRPMHISPGRPASPVGLAMTT